MRSASQYFFCLVVALASLWTAAPSADALPRMGLTAGSPCSTCHVNKQGGGMRSMIGWGSMAYTGMVDYEDLGVDWLADMYSNEVVEERVSVGVDARLQVARMGRPNIELDDNDQQRVVTPERRLIPMQLQPHALVELTDWVKVHGSWAAGPNTSDGQWCDTPFPGQSCYMAQAIFEPSPQWPSVRAGMFQPSIGIRHDDHTMLIRHDASRPRANLVPINYAELGAEASYHPVHWLRVEAGGFQPANLADAVGNAEVVSTDDPAYLGRVSWLPRFEVGDDFSFSGMFGVSGYGAGDFHMQNAFAGLGLLDRASLLLEAARFTRGESTDGLNLSSVLSIQTYEWLIFEGRLEQAVVTVDDQDFQTRAAVVGVQYFPIPYVKLRPEYRYMITDDWAMGQYTAQLHVFY